MNYNSKNLIYYAMKKKSTSFNMRREKMVGENLREENREAISELFSRMISVQ